MNLLNNRGVKVTVSDELADFYVSRLGYKRPTAAKPAVSEDAKPKRTKTQES